MKGGEGPGRNAEGSRRGSGLSKKARGYGNGFVWCLESGPEMASENPQNISGMSALKGGNLVHCSTSSHSSWLRLRTILSRIWSGLWEAAVSLHPFRKVQRREMRKTPKKPWNLCLKSTSAALERHIKGMLLWQDCLCNLQGGSYREQFGASLALQETQDNTCYLLAGEFWHLFPLNSDFFIHKVIIMVAIIKCSSE